MTTITAEREVIQATPREDVTWPIGEGVAVKQSHEQQNYQSTNESLNNQRKRKEYSIAPFSGSGVFSRYVFERTLGRRVVRRGSG